jgi:predicted O-linked N-acetylglucosamine transferase (SPINDLY family)
VESPPGVQLLLARALRHHQAGRLSEAEPLYRQMVVRDPRHSDGLHLLGMIAYQVRCHGSAARLIRQAIAVDGSQSSYYSNLALVLWEQGRLAEAAACCRKALALRPDDSAGHINLGNPLRQQGRLPEAVAWLRRAVHLAPNHPEAHNNLGSLLRDLGRLAEAAASYRTALELRPDYPEAHNNLGTALEEQGLMGAALVCYCRTLTFRPDYGEALRNLGNALRGLGRWEDAVLSCRRALILSPHAAAAHNDLGLALREQGRLNEAIASYRRAVSAEPDAPQAHGNLGNVLNELGRLDEAIACCRRAAALAPGHPQAHNNLGVALKDVGRLAEALAAVRTAIGLKPDFAEAFNTLGNTMQAQGRWDEAAACYRMALEIAPYAAGPHYNLGNALLDRARLSEAIDCFRLAIACQPDCREAHNNLANACKDLGRLDEAGACFRRALDIDARYVEAHSNLLFCLNYHPDLPAEEIFAEYRRWEAQHARPPGGPMTAHANLRDPERRLRIGYVSPDFRRHSARHFIEPLLSRHDRGAVDVFAYANHPIDDEVTARIKTYVDHWQPTLGLGDESLAELIRADRIDILVDLAGHTRGNRLLTFARKPAPVQVASWLGYGYTTGLSAMDYFLGDAVFTPPGCEGVFAEQVVRLPVFAAYRPAEGMGEVGPLPAIGRGHITFGTLTRMVRINHRVVRAWAAILRQLPTARLVINSGDLRSCRLKQELGERFATHGIAAGRLVLGYDSPPWDVLRSIDIGLDCFPHNSGTTLCETLRMGVPFVTLADRPSVGRLGASLLTAVGHPEWIACSEADYVEKAVALAADLPRLAAVRVGLRDAMQNSPLQDETGFARAVEAAYRVMWRTWCAAGQVARF